MRRSPKKPLDLLEPEIPNHQQEAEWMQKHIDKTKNRLYVSWRNSKGADCKMVGPETKCFCNHRSKQHDHSQLLLKKVNCKAPKCPCQQFYYIPTHGAYDFKCLCKHSFKEHDPVTRKCKKGKCTGCLGAGGKFGSTWTCSCGLKFGEHTTVVETYQERKAAGRLLGDMERMGEELDQPLVKGGLLHPQQVQVEKPLPPKKQEMTAEERKKRQLARLNHLIAANQLQEEKDYVKEQIEQPQVQGEVSMFELYNRPHNYRKVTVELKRRL